MSFGAKKVEIPLHLKSHTTLQTVTRLTHLPSFTHFSFVFVYSEAQVRETLLIRTLATPSGHKQTLQSYCTYLNAVHILQDFTAK